MRAVATVTLLAGCFIEPARPPGGPGNGSSDSGCTASWSSPVQLGGSWHDSQTSDTSPWMSADGTELWFARHPSSGGTELMFATGSGAVFGTPSAGISMETFPYEDNPSFDNSELTGFFDIGSAGSQIICEAHRTQSHSPLPSNVAMHSELPAGSMEPWISADGAMLLYARDDGAGAFGLFKATRTGSSGFAQEQGLQLGRSGESPSLSPSGELFYTDHQGGHTQIWVGVLTGATVGSPQPAFVQIDGDSYFDPSISRDGRTLVFAHEPAGLVATIEYVQRSCD